MRCGQDWQPTEIKRVIERFASSTEVVLVQTDAGNGFLKGMGNQQGNEALASEFVGSELAARVGLFVPPFAVVDVAGLQIQTRSGRILAAGPAFISKAIEQVVTADPDGTYLRRLRRRTDLSLLIAFDTWVRNADRCPPPGHLVPEPNRDNLLFRSVGGWWELVAFDHTHCFVLEDLASGLESCIFVEDTGIYGAFPEFWPYIDEDGLRMACRAIAAIDEAEVVEIIAAVPQAWGPSQAVRELWAQRIINRAARVEEFVLAGMVAQGQMGF